VSCHGSRDSALPDDFRRERRRGGRGVTIVLAGRGRARLAPDARRCRRRDGRAGGDRRDPRAGAAIDPDRLPSVRSRCGPPRFRHPVDRKAILRASGYKPLPDEGAAFQRTRAEAQRAGQVESGRMDWYSFTVAFKGVLLATRTGRVGRALFHGVRAGDSALGAGASQSLSHTLSAVPAPRSLLMPRTTPRSLARTLHTP
jgi:hypothetical protein